MTKVLFFDPGDSAAVETLRRGVHETIPPSELEIFPTLEMLTRGLCRPKATIRLAILAIPTREILHSLLTQRALLRDIYIVSALPDQESETISAAHILQPRIVTYLNSSREEIGEILAGVYRLVTEGDRFPPASLVPDSHPVNSTDKDVFWHKRRRKEMELHNEQTSGEDRGYLDGTQFVSFMLGDEEYGVPIMQVQEIIRFERLTSIPQSAEFVRGVLNLRGRVMPVIDLRRKFRLEECEGDRHTRIIVIDTESRKMGMVVDEVSEVITIEPEKIEPAPELGTKVRTDFIRGMGKMEDRLLILLDIDKVLTAEEAVAVDEATCAAS